MKSFMILGMGRFGSAIAESLYLAGNDVLVVDNNAEIINDMADRVTQAVVGDICDENTLKSLGARNFDIVILAIAGSIESSIMSTMILKDMGVKYLIVKAQSQLHSKILKKMGADKILMPERDMGIRLAQTLVRGDFLDYIQLSPDYSIIELKVPQNWFGKSIYDLEIRAKFGINILAVKNAEGINAEPDANYIFKQDDIMIVMGSNKRISKIK